MNFAESRVQGIKEGEGRNQNEHGDLGMQAERDHEGQGDHAPAWARQCLCCKVGRGSN